MPANLFLSQKIGKKKNGFSMSSRRECPLNGTNCLEHHLFHLVPHYSVQDGGRLAFTGIPDTPNYYGKAGGEDLCQYKRQAEKRPYPDLSTVSLSALNEDR